MLSDVHQASIDTINGIINRVCEKEENQVSQKKGWFARLFSVSVDEPSSPKYVLNPGAVEELKEDKKAQIINIFDSVKN